MNEFSLIANFFKNQAIRSPEVVFGIGDDAACLKIPLGQQLLVSTDTLVAEVHFLSQWDAFDIAWKAVMVNISDIAAMGGSPCWLSLALTMPDYNEHWLTRFSQGLHAALQKFQISLIGGDTTRGPLSLTLTIHGLIPEGKAVRRSGAKPGDTIWVSGELGAAAQAVAFLNNKRIPAADMAILLKKLQQPKPRTDLKGILQNYASAAIDISDGLAADLNHICEESQVGACLFMDLLPIHSLVRKYQAENAFHFALAGGDDYELCFTAPAQYNHTLEAVFNQQGLACFSIGLIEESPGLRGKNSAGDTIVLSPRGYSHF